jgi:hypothetical protein
MKQWPPFEFSWSVRGFYTESVNCLDGFSFARVNVYPASRMRTLKTPLRTLAIIVLATAGCSGNNDNSQTTATTFVSPPPRQVLKAEFRPGKRIPAKPDDPKKRVNLDEPLLTLNLANGATFKTDSEVAIDFSLANAKLKGEGGEFRVRYIVDDDDLQWIDRWEQVVLTGWIPGEHRIRVELIGPDGWPYRNGDYNIETRQITIVK